jgi:D-glycero-D-manno-heptose 1,7-bisphosphate phosphatase
MAPDTAIRYDNNKVVVLDRDGTIVVDRHYLADPDGLEFEPGAGRALRSMSDMGYRLVVVTNQSGLARGYFTVDQLEKIHARMRQMLNAEGVQIAGIYFCPHDPSDGCECRKPGLGLMRQAAEELRFDMSQSVVIGDKDSDIEMGRRAKALTMLIGAEPMVPSSSNGPDYVIKDLTEAASILRLLAR